MAGKSGRAVESQFGCDVIDSRPVFSGDLERSVVARTHPILTVLCRRATWLSIAVAVVALSWGGQSADAGVMLPWAQEHSASLADFEMADAVGSASAPAQPAPAPEKRSGDDRGRSKVAAVQGIAPVSVGASAPVSSTLAQSSAVAALVAGAPAAGLVARSFAYWRERSPELPNPPLGELLDPPKACA